MVERFIDVFGTFEQIKKSKSMLTDSKIEFKILTSREIIPGRLYTIEVKVKGGLDKINEFIELLEKTY